jgi:hypothetical protein
MKRVSPFSRIVAARPWVALAALFLALLIPQPALAGQYWTGFEKFWAEYFGRQNGVVMAAIVIGAISIFIVTRGKWKK